MMCTPVFGDWDTYSVGQTMPVDVTVDLDPVAQQGMRRGYDVSQTLVLFSFIGFVYSFVVCLFHFLSLCLFSY